MTWLQAYNPCGSIALSALVAVIPLLVLFYLLAFKRTPGHIAGAASLLCAILVSIIVWGMPVGLALNATLSGAAYGLFPILWIVITAIWMYNMTVESGQFSILKDSLAHLTDDRRLQVIIIAFMLGAFLEGTAGFGTPVAITAAMLVGLGFQPRYAGGLCLLANCAPVAFGGIGIPIYVAAQVSGIDAGTLSKVMAVQIPLLAIILPFWACILLCGVRKTFEIFPLLLVAGVGFGGVQGALAWFHGPNLPDIVAAVAGLIMMIGAMRVWRPATSWHFPGEDAPVLGPLPYSGGVVLRAWAPYILLAGLVFIWGLPECKLLLDKLTGSLAAGFSWPGLDGLVIKTQPIVPTDAPLPALFKLNILSTAGTAILFAGLLSVLFMPGYSFGQALGCFFRTLHQLRFAILSVMLFLGLGSIMNYSGMSSTLGLALTGTGWLFPFFSPILGWLGVFLTGSDTSSNALFCGMQGTTAQAIGIPPELTVAANTTGGGVGKMISPQSIAVAAAATNMVGNESSFFRFTVWHSFALVGLVGLLTFLQSNILGWMLP